MSQMLCDGYTFFWHYSYSRVILFDRAFVPQNINFSHTKAPFHSDNYAQIITEFPHTELMIALVSCLLCEEVKESVALFI